MDLDKARELLGKSGENMSDDELKEAIETAELLANIAIDHLIKTPKKDQNSLKKNSIIDYDS